MSEKAVLHVKKQDPKMAKLIDEVGPFRLKRKRGESLFKALARSIAYQQLSGKAAATIFERLKHFVEGKPFPDPEDLLEADIEDLRAVGLSRAKATYLQDLAEKHLDGVVPDARRLRRLSDDEIIDRLTQIKGIGRWSVEMILIFNLGRLDVLPVHDLGVRKGFAQVYRKKELPTPSQLKRYGEIWRPYRTVPAWYLWRALEL